MLRVDLGYALAAVAVLLVAWYLSWTATRLDRLHARVEGSRSALDTQLQRRASAAQQLAVSGVLDPASSLLLAQAAHDAREAEEDEVEPRQSELTRALRAALEPEAVELVSTDPAGRTLLAELAAACHRVELSRRFHNDAVRAAAAVRSRRVVRWLRLAGHAPPPRTFEMDDEVPASLRVPG